MVPSQNSLFESRLYYWSKFTCRYHRLFSSGVLVRRRSVDMISQSMNEPVHDPASSASVFSSTSSSSESVHTVTRCSSSSSPPMPILTISDYLDGLHCVHEAQKVNARPEEIIIKLRLYLEDKVGGKDILKTIMTLIRTKQIIDFTNDKEYEYCTSLLPLFMILICLENSLEERR